MPVTDPTAVQPTPLTDAVELVRMKDSAEGSRASARITVDPDNQIFAGHYPGLPIFPGVGLIEGVHRTVLAMARSGEIEPVLGAVLSARFLSPVFPRDEIEVQVLVTKDPRCWTAAARLHVRGGLVAKVSLRYRVPGDVS
jgi:3-hydroxyacyl-[acyl-carrier-protein] dehydratase